MEGRYRCRMWDTREHIGGCGMRLMKYLLCILAVLMLSACAGDDSEEIKSGYSIYYVNSDENNIAAKAYQAKSSERDGMIKEFLGQLEDCGDSTEYRAALPEEVQLVEYTVNDTTLSLKFNAEYRQMSNTAEILMRTSYVKTLVQIPGIDYVDFYIGEEPLQDSNGNIIGSMNEETFVDNSGGQINEYEEADLILYYANEKGDKLKQTMKTIVYDQNIPLEKVVIQQLIKGPAEGKDLYPTIPENTKLLSVTVKDSICYVNFDEEFVKLENDVTEQVQIYSLVNSLAELPTVSRVQISINGISDRTFVEKIDFNTIFERNLDIIETQKEDEPVD